MAKRSLLKIKIVTAVLVALIVLLVVLNPSEAKHRDAIYDHIRRQQEKDGDAAAFAVSTVLKSLDAFKAAPMQRTSYLLFSTTQLELGVAKYKTIGVLGFVYVYK